MINALDGHRCKVWSLHFTPLTSDKKVLTPRMLRVRLYNWYVYMVWLKYYK